MSTTRARASPTLPYNRLPVEVAVLTFDSSHHAITPVLSLAFPYRIMEAMRKLTARQLEGRLLKGRKRPQV